MFLILGNYIFFYPIIATIFWIVGSRLYYYFFEVHQEVDVNRITHNKFQIFPKVSIFIPCYNEEATLYDAVISMVDLEYPDYEIVLIDDCSSDGTLDVMYRLANASSKIRVVALEENKGKANALNEALKHTDSEYILGVDADAMLTEDALMQLVLRMLGDPKGKIGAVTGSPRVRNRTTLLGQLQLVEYATIIGMLKRAQLLIGNIMTISGVIVLFRKEALERIGGWDTTMITEDIAVTWNMYRNGYEVVYEPRAHCWILVPETVRGLLKQRKRWAQGGIEVLKKNADIIVHGKFSLRFLLIEQIASILWVILVNITAILVLLKSNTLDTYFMLLSFSAFVFTLLSILQMYVAFQYELRYEKGVWKYLIVAPMFSMMYWLISFISITRALPTFFKDNKTFAVWHSPDRGV